MKNKSKRTHNPDWKDNTRSERQKKRRNRLNQIAQVAGYKSWSEFETDVLNERSKLPIKK